ELELVLPAEVADLIREQLQAVAGTSHGTQLSLAALASIGVAVWGASGAMRRVMEALNVVHGAEETRSFVRKLLTSVLLASGAIVVSAVTVAAIVLGGDVAAKVFGVVGLGADAATAWQWLRWPVLLALVWLGIASAYRFAPASRKVG